MNDTIFTAVVYGFLGLATVMTVLFLGMMIADDFHTNHTNNKDHTK